MKNSHFMMIFLVLIVGTASAEHVCVADDGTAFFCGDTVTKSCTLNGSMVCSLGAGLIVGADNITINGNGHALNGVKAYTTVWESNAHESTTKRMMT